MVSCDVDHLVYDVRLSSVVPAKVTGEGTVHELTNMDLIMKLHYLRGVYFFKNDAVLGLDIYELKSSMPNWLGIYYPVSGRVRRSENGRPVIKCNDTGVRIVEAKCKQTIDEWLDMNDHELNDCLAYNHTLGPDLDFSPLVFIQFTWFKCGGISVGLSWAHILGDPLSASAFINMFGQITGGQFPPESLKLPSTRKDQFLPPSVSRKPFSLKKVDPVGDHWLISSKNSKMQTHSFHFTGKQLKNILSKNHGLSQTTNSAPFEVLSAVIWKSLAKIKGKSQLRIVTICRNWNSCNRENEICSNVQLISIVEADFNVENADLLELANLMAEKMVDESSMIEELMKKDEENSDFIVYGANLTFVDLEEANVYGLELKGHKPVFVNYSVDGVGEEGLVLVLPGLETGKNEGGGGRTVTVTLPENHLAELKNELESEWGCLVL